jgi:predicted transcriptional regulator
MHYIDRSLGKTMSSATIPMSIRLEPTAKKKLQELATRQKRTAHALAIEAINTLIQQKESEYAFNQSCLDSYNEYKETGLHVTHEELTPWLDSLFTEDELKPPSCHT